MAIIPFEDFSFTPRQELVPEIAILLHELVDGSEDVHVIQAASRIVDLVDCAHYVPAEDED